MQDDIPSKLTPLKNSTVEGFFIELNLREKKWLLCYTYNLNSSFISAYLNAIGNNIDLLLANYKNFLLTGDLNGKGHNGCLKGTVMQIEKALKNGHLRVSKV